MKAIWNNFKVAFAMYSKIPVPQADWEKENMKYALCFFPYPLCFCGNRRNS